MFHACTHVKHSEWPFFRDHKRRRRVVCRKQRRINDSQSCKIRPSRTLKALLWTIIAWIGATQGLALTLAGVTGLIVSIGVSVDSNVVYFENVKEDVKGGRTVTKLILSSKSTVNALKASWTGLL